MREEHRLTVFENWVLRKTTGPKSDEVEVTREWRTQHNEELNDLYCSPNIIRVIKSRRMRWTGQVAGTADHGGEYGVLVESPEGKRPHGKLRRRWEDNIKMDF